MKLKLAIAVHRAHMWMVSVDLG